MLLLANRIGFHNEAAEFIQIFGPRESEIMSMILGRKCLYAVKAWLFIPLGENQVADDL